MATATKLPSGAWRTLASKTINGKKKSKSFTVHPDSCGGNSRKAQLQSEKLARDWQMDSKGEDPSDLTVKEAIETYIKDKNKVLSVSTIRGYKFVLEALKPFWNISINELETPQIQRLVNEWGLDYKTKTIKNRIALLLSVLDYFGIYKKFKIRYPQNPSKKVVSPDSQDVQMFVDNATGVMIPIIYLAAFGGLRRGEIAALKGKNISKDMCTVTINADMVLDSDNVWTYKPFPKTNDSVRTVRLPKFVIEALPDPGLNDYLFELTPAAMSDRFGRLAKKLSLNYTLHSLRHYAASFRSDLGIPQKYIEEVGGWSEKSSVMSQIYDNGLESSRQKYTRIALKFLEDNFAPEALRKNS